MPRSAQQTCISLLVTILLFALKSGFSKFVVFEVESDRETLRGQFLDIFLEIHIKIKMNLRKHNDLSIGESNLVRIQRELHSRKVAIKDLGRGLEIEPHRKKQVDYFLLNCCPLLGHALNRMNPEVGSARSRGSSRNKVMDYNSSAPNRKANELGLQVRQLQLVNTKHKISLLLHTQVPIVRQRLLSTKQATPPCPPKPMLFQHSLNTRPIRTSARPHRFAPNEGTHKIYEERFTKYLDFVHLSNFAHKALLNLKLAEQDAPIVKYKFYVGSGNNSTLIREMIKKKFWWVQTKSITQANFVWTQLKQDSLHYAQLSAFIPKQPTIRSLYTQQIKTLRQEHSQQKILSSSQLKQLDHLKSTRQKSSLQTLLKPPIRDCHEFTPSLSSRMTNHLSKNHILGNKKNLFYNMKGYYTAHGRDVFQYLPLTFHIRKGESDPEYAAFLEVCRTITQKMWIVKPGQNSNQGKGIRVVQAEAIPALINLKQKHANKERVTYILQLYIQKPLLYKGRKFDIRHFMLVTSLHGVRRGYWSTLGYVRTAGHPFTMSTFNPLVHLTNDFVQRNSQNYGRYQPANKLSYVELRQYVKEHYGRDLKEVFGRLREIGVDVLQSCGVRLDPARKQANFQLFGLDFMIDQDFKPWLIEVNTNPCLQTPCSLLSRLIPQLLQHTLLLTQDTLFPPPCHYPNTAKHLAPSLQLSKLCFQLIVEQNEEDAVPEAMIYDEPGDDQTFQSDGQGTEEQEVKSHGGFQK